MREQTRRSIPPTRLAAPASIGSCATPACLAATCGAPRPPHILPLPPTPYSRPSSSESRRPPVLQRAAPLAGNLAASSSAAPDAAPPKGGGAAPCPYGTVEDPHLGFVRCLAQGEKSPILTDDTDGGQS